MYAAAKQSEYGINMDRKENLKPELQMKTKEAKAVEPKQKVSGIFELFILYCFEKTFCKDRQSIHDISKTAFIYSTTSLCLKHILRIVTIGSVLYCRIYFFSCFKYIIGAARIIFECYIRRIFTDYIFNVFSSENTFAKSKRAYILQRVREDKQP